MLLRTHKLVKEYLRASCDSQASNSHSVTEFFCLYYLTLHAQMSVHTYSSLLTGSLVLLH